MNLVLVIQILDKGENIMTNKVQEKKEIFLNKKAEYDKIRQDDNELYERLNAAEENIVSLQEEMDSLKQKYGIPDYDVQRVRFTEFFND